MKFNNSNKLKAEITLRSLSDKAYEVYSGIDSLAVYEVDNKFYLRGALEYDELSLEELDQLFCDMADEWEG